jgi:glycosyltransferase involved in cell wall biosynthesis
VARYRKRLTIGMATYDDYDGVYFTLQSLRLHHPEVADDIEFVVVDNNPDGACGTHLKALERQIPHYRYIPVRERSGTAVRNYVMAEASSDFVLNLDCHVLIAPGAINRLMQYFEADPYMPDLLQGPLVYDNLATLATHMEPVWRGGMYGIWSSDNAGKDPDAPAFDIPLQGLGLYACRRAAWPGYNPRFRGFGGEEGYIHEKFRQAGGRTLCLPFLRWVHRFARPLGIPYKNSWDDRVRNYFIGFAELGLPLEPVEAHFREFLGAHAEALLDKARNELSGIR